MKGADDIVSNWLADAQVVGITAGAGTPNDVIQDVVDTPTARGFAPPEEGIRPVDPDYVPTY